MAKKIEDGIEYWDTGEDGWLDLFLSGPETKKALQEYLDKHPEEKAKDS